MNYLTDLESACAFLGNKSQDGASGDAYERGEDCLECAKDLVRLLRRDDASHVLRRTLGQIGVLYTDLLPLFKQLGTASSAGAREGEDTELFEIVLRVLCNLTVSEEILFNNELPEEKTTRNFYIQLQTYRQTYKEYFVDEVVWSVLNAKLADLLRKDYDERTEEDSLSIERILILVRNILQVPRDARSENRIDDDATIHDKVLWCMKKSGIHDLLLFMASSHSESQYCLHILEIISLIFREQDPKQVATANFQRSKDERREDERALVKVREEEEAKKKAKFHATKSARHSRFGGVFTVRNVKSISDNRDLIYHKPLAKVADIDFDKAKRPLKVSKNRVTPNDCDNATRRSTLSIRLFLKQFCLEFVNGAYNTLMRAVRDNLERQRAQKNDETYYLWAIRFFMEFNRSHKFRVELVTETLSTSTYYFIQQRIEDYKDNFDHEKKNRPMCLLWARRMHLGLRAVQELLMNLVVMTNSAKAGGSPELTQSASVLKANILYEPEYRELCLTLFNIYQPEKFSLGFVRDLAETTHVFLKLMESMAKNKHMMVRSKKVVRRKKKAKKAEKQESKRQSNEEKWDSVSGLVSALLQGQEEAATGMTPFDAASDVPIDEQKATALFRIQDLLRAEKVSEAVGLLRAARQVWPENDSFGKGEDAEEEFMEIRQILFAEIPRPKHLEPSDVHDVGVEEAANGNVEEEDEDDEEEEVVEQYVSTEQEFDYKQFLGRFACKSVCAAYSNLLQNFRKNSGHTNHCVIKMFHRIALECGQPAMLFHISILKTFQAIHRDHLIHPSDAGLREMNRFASHVLNRFFELCRTNRKAFMELCFWKTSKDAHQIVEGYDKETSSGRQKKSYWSEDLEENLRRVFAQLKEGGGHDPQEGGGGDDGDLLDAITAHFVESNKSRRQVAKKLKDLGLIQNIREVTRKPVRSEVSWAEEEVESLRRCYAEFKDAHNPVARIREHLGTKKSTRNIISKIMDLGLCDDRKSLMAKSGRKRRTREDGEKGGSSSETDSALEDSSSGGDDDEDDEEEDDDPAAVAANENAADGPKKKDLLVQLLDKFVAAEDLRPVIDWLKTSLAEEADDRGDDPDEVEDVPLVPIAQDVIVALDAGGQDFQQLFELLQMSPPSNQQEQYWRIPASLSVPSLRAKAQVLDRALQKEDDVTRELDMTLVVGQEQASDVTSKKKKKKKEKRGPNKWMPVRRQVDDDLQKRIEEAVGVSQKETPSGAADSANSETKSKKKKKTPEKKSKAKKKRTPAKPKKKSFIDESDDDDDEENEGINAELEKSGKKQLNNQSKKSSFPADDSSSGSESHPSDESEVEAGDGKGNENTVSPSISKKKKPVRGRRRSAFLDDSSSEDEGGPKDANETGDAASGDDESDAGQAKKKATKSSSAKSKRKVLDDSSSSYDDDDNDKSASVDKSKAKMLDSDDNDDDDAMDKHKAADKKGQRKSKVLDDSSSDEGPEDLNVKGREYKAKASDDDDNSSFADEKNKKESNTKKVASIANDYESGKKTLPKSLNVSEVNSLLQLEESSSEEDGNAAEVKKSKKTTVTLDSSDEDDNVAEVKKTKKTTVTLDSSDEDYNVADVKKVKKKKRTTVTLDSSDDESAASPSKSARSRVSSRSSSPKYVDKTLNSTTTDRDFSLASFNRSRRSSSSSSSASSGGGGRSRSSSPVHYVTATPTKLQQHDAATPTAPADGELGKAKRQRTSSGSSDSISKRAKIGSSRDDDGVDSSDDDAGSANEKPQSKKRKAKAVLSSDDEDSEPLSDIV